MLTISDHLIVLICLEMASGVVCSITLSGMEVRVTSLSHPDPPFFKFHLLSSSCQEPPPFARAVCEMIYS